MILWRFRRPKAVETAEVRGLDPDRVVMSWDIPVDTPVGDRTREEHAAIEAYLARRRKERSLAGRVRRLAAYLRKRVKSEK
jgi:hypothetical protein